MRVEGTRAFSAPRETVWEVLDSPARMAKLMPGVESFDVNVPVKKGEQLAMYTKGSTSMIRCSSGGDNTLIYLNGKYSQQPFSPATETDGCWILIEAVIR